MAAQKPIHQAGLALQLQELRQTQRDLVQQGLALIRQWNDTFPRGTTSFRLARLSGESNTLLRWRRTSDANRTRGHRFELVDQPTLLDALPEAVRPRVLDFEDRRIRLNYEHAIATYRMQRLQELLRRRDALAQLRRPATLPDRSPCRT
ncbi:MAG: hypothetical protein VX836_20260 [Pseudomonadota bacterium]|nr:hypothetical protein [Pseudomonadota bacterium]